MEFVYSVYRAERIVGPQAATEWERGSRGGVVRPTDCASVASGKPSRHDHELAECSKIANKRCLDAVIAEIVATTTRASCFFVRTLLWLKENKW